LERARQQLAAARDDLQGAAAHARGHEESAAIFRQKYAVAMEKARRVRGRADGLEEELHYAQQQVSAAMTVVLF